MRQPLDKSLCKACQSRKIDYATSTTGARLQHGYCRSCYESYAAKHMSGGGSRRDGRTSEMRENQYETKYGRD